MTLKAIYYNQADIPEGMQDHYVKTDSGRFELALDKDTIKEHSSTFALRQAYDRTMEEKKEYKHKLSQLSAQYDGIDADAARELLENKAQLERQELMKKGDFEALLAQEKAEVENQYTQQISQLEDSTKNYKAQVETMLLENMITQAVLSQKGFREEALTDAIERARKIFRVVEGDEGKIEIKALDPSGQAIAHEGKPLNVETWAKRLKEEASHFFAHSSGGGALYGKMRSGGEKFDPTIPAKDRLNRARRGA